MLSVVPIVKPVCVTKTETHKTKKKPISGDPPLAIDLGPDSKTKSRQSAGLKDIL